MRCATEQLLKASKATPVVDTDEAIRSVVREIREIEEAHVAPNLERLAYRGMRSEVMGEEERAFCAALYDWRRFVKNTCWRVVQYYNAK